MKCGNTRKLGAHDHETVAEVRACYGVATDGNTSDTASEKKTTDFNKFTNLSPRQQKFLGDLLNQLGLELDDGLTPATIPYAKGKSILDGLVEARRNQAMSKAYKLPDGVLQSANPHKGKPRTRTSTQRVPLPDVPAGYYAVPDWTGKEELKFFRVKRPGKDSEWAGRTFVDQVVGGHPAMKCHGDFMRKALEAILEFGPEDAGILYGVKIGQCYNCNRSLTKKASRTLSLGQKCAHMKGYGAEWEALNAQFGGADADDEDGE